MKIEEFLFRLLYILFEDNWEEEVMGNFYEFWEKHEEEIDKYFTKEQLNILWDRRK